MSGSKDRFVAYPEHGPGEYTKNETWRIFRIMAEFIDSFETMSRYERLVTVFGSARLSSDDPLYQDCVRLGGLLAEQNYGVVSGGGPGIMEAANRGAWMKKGVSVGLNIKLPMEQHPNLYQSESIDFRYFFIRKVCFLKYSVAAVAYPGGFGTFDEVAEVLTMIQTGKVRRIPFVLIGKDFFGPMIDWFRGTMLPRKMISEEDMEIFHTAENAEEALRFILDWHRKYGISSSIRDDF